MADPVWGQLNKAQDDSTTIDEAIAQAIADHNDDPEAHIGTDQSLETHRANGVIDHPAGSVLADKATLTEVIIDTIFESIDTWSTTGDVTASDLSGVALYVEYGATNSSRIHGNPQIPANFFSSGANLLFQIIARFDLSNEHIHAWFGFLTGYADTVDGFGFQVRDGSLYAHVRCGGTTSEEELASVDISADHVYRAQYSADENTVTFYIDGSVVATIERPTGTSWNDDRGPDMGATVTETNDGNFRIAQLYASRNL